MHKFFKIKYLVQCGEPASWTRYVKTSGGKMNINLEYVIAALLAKLFGKLALIKL